RSGSSASSTVSGVRALMKVTRSCERVSCPSSWRRQCPVEVVDEHASALEAYGHTHEAARDPLRIELRSVRAAIRRDDQALDAAPAHADPEVSDCIDDTPHILVACRVELEAEESCVAGQRR